MFRRHHEKTKKPSITKRFFRSSVSIVIISSFVLTVTYGVKFLAEKNPRMAFYEYSKSLPTDSRLGQVAGALTEKYEDYIIEKGKDTIAPESTTNTNNTLYMPSNPTGKTRNDSVSTSGSESADMTSKETYLVGLFADSHLDKINLNKAINLASSKNVDVIVHLGDHTNLGLLADLQEAKKLLDESNIKYYAIPGDRDLWETSGPENFIKVFGTNRHTFTLGSYKFVVLDNSKNFSKISTEDMDWFRNEVIDASFVLLSQPLYHPSNKVMGTFEGENIVSVREQGDTLLDLIRQSNVKAVIAGDHHLSSEVLDPVKPELIHYVIGAITGEINDKPQAVLQTSRISILELLPDGTFKMYEELL